MKTTKPETILSPLGRGIFMLRGGRRGTILINVLNLEDYLKGVVPGELSPYCFGEIEALKAQAIAARTYALKNLDRFDDLGFDLFVTARRTRRAAPPTFSSRGRVGGMASAYARSELS